MGGGESRVETRFNFVDTTTQILEFAREAEERRLAEERRRIEAEERRRIEKEREDRIEFERQCYLAEQDEIRRAEELSLILEQERLERERQKKIELETKAAEERSALFNYKLGNRTKFQNVRSLNLSKLRIGVFGPTGSGKSCFINTCERAVLQTDKGSVPIATSGSEGTIVLEDYLSQMFFRLVDTRGFFSYDHHEGREMTDIMYGRIKSGDPIGRQRIKQIYNEGSEEVPLEEWLHGVVLVVKANDVRLRNGSLEMYLKPMREILHSVGLSPVAVVTHRDTLHTQEECDNALESASAATGSSRSHTFFVANYCPNNPGPNVETELEIFEILRVALFNSEKYVANAKQRRNEKIEVEIKKALDSKMTRKPHAIVTEAPVDVFLGAMKSKYEWPEETLHSLLKTLNEQDVKTLDILASCWTDIHCEFPLYWSKTVEAALKKMLMI
ncbi:uncharacterized protein LOC116304710 [Actinia tenebrosa]|uniref:Uncharacterized protein LOC116304710 n=1 Tax=Actinia tenebrosa TaxID=6105 RepID=A0A6P8IWB1_ACTTE|nr:uncharacterized protein LOC116304710 [Actinia tenebrosa]